MKHRILPMGLLLAIIILICTALYWNGDYVVYMLTYIFAFVFLLCYAAFAASTITEKIAQVMVYALILAAQILFSVLVMRPTFGTGQLFVLYRMLGVLIIFAPFLIRQIWFCRHTNRCIAPSVQDWAALSYSQLLQDQEPDRGKNCSDPKNRKALIKKLPAGNR